jgi:hypothetical protein
MAQERHCIAGATGTSLMLNAVSSNDADLLRRGEQFCRHRDQRRCHFDGSTGDGQSNPRPSPPNPPVKPVNAGANVVFTVVATELRR